MRLLEKIERSAGQLKAAKWLGIGCEPGRLLRLRLEFLKSGFIGAVELSPAVERGRTDAPAATKRGDAELGALIIGQNLANFFLTMVFHAPKLGGILSPGKMGWSGGYTQTSPNLK